MLKICLRKGCFPFLLYLGQVGGARFPDPPASTSGFTGNEYDSFKDKIRIHLLEKYCTLNSQNVGVESLLSNGYFTPIFNQNLNRINYERYTRFSSQMNYTNIFHGRKGRLFT